MGAALRDSLITKDKHVMDGTRFDQLIKSMATTRVSRLTALRGLAVGAVAAIAGVNFGAEDVEAARSRRCKPKPNQCQTCKKGKCHRNNNGEKKCHRGKLRPKANGTLCSIPGATSATCRNGACIAAVTPVGCTGTNNVPNTQGSCPAGQLCNSNFICVAGCTGTNNTQGTCPTGQLCVNGQCQGQTPAVGCSPPNNTRGTCPAGQVC